MKRKMDEEKKKDEPEEVAAPNVSKESKMSIHTDGKKSPDIETKNIFGANAGIGLSSL